jgi:Mn2+/Fe2+ NRAMP family transporter
MKPRSVLGALGPGLAVAATGVGAGDLMAALVAGADFGLAVLWAIVVGALLKLALNEGLARWQLATGSTLLEGWVRHLGRPFRLWFSVYLVLWSFIVAGGLLSACGVAAQALTGRGDAALWGVLHSAAAVVLVLRGRYALFERLMKGLIALMVLTLVGSVALLAPPPAELATGLLVPRLPAGSAPALLGLMGGIGGSVTLLSYGYWIAERGWRGEERLGLVRLDLAVGYLLTGLFGAAMLVLAAVVLGGGEGLPPGSAGLVACGDAVGAAVSDRFGPAGGAALRLVFLVGVWGAVFTSTLGVWQGVPYLFADFLAARAGRPAGAVDVAARPYRLWLLFLALPPLVLLLGGRPVLVIRVYTAVSGLFLPLLAASLLWMNRPPRVGGLANGRLAVLALGAALLLFAALLVRQLVDL